ncbi:hypothetical protein GTP58_04480 [Duganella sp. CY15W]|uniref:hypothetical protein n=1 Tax=Duganella sp. CY15W TaxID=2692172 RepID=UPI001367C151|nr:hypothetical protein [Duganella sp. CY15W]MYM27567.1 hypothetical protein [Duganella sp. CY15W]
MRTSISHRRTAWVLAALTLAAVLYEGYRPVGASGLPPQMARCEAEGGALRAQIRYDSGRTLRYCSVVAMFAQLAAQEQPGLVRAALVLDGDGRWIDARSLHGYRELLAACGRTRCG